MSWWAAGRRHMTIEMKFVFASLFAFAISACGEDPPAANPPPNVPTGSTVNTSTTPAPVLPPPTALAPIPKPVSPAAPPAQVTLTIDECKSAQKKLDALKKEEMTTKDAQQVYFVVKAANCDQRQPSVTEAQRTCLGFPQYAASSFVSCVTP